MAATDHETLVRDATRDDPQAIDVLLAHNYPRLLAFVRLHAGPVVRRHESCADIVQSVCREVLEDLGDFEYRGEAAFRNWLFTRTIGKLRNRRRYYLAKKRHAEDAALPLSVGECRGIEAVYARLGSPSEGAIARETAERLELAFDRLPEDERRVITLARIVGMSHAEIAAEMGCPEGTVRARLHRALVRLGSLMQSVVGG